MNEKDLKELADDVVGAVADYPHQDPYEVMDEVIRIITEQEELTGSQVDRLRKYVNDLI